ncbi:hypothetical protein [Stenotrophomonas lactitubi]|uniref:hypothetical protein n=1 Tax=Stenotrophomonas lactitubi TaxID=2045214 RepID=UPI00203AE861|nr:hypothetical protein [Stenotrophomonas lactitubi]
MEQTIQRAGQCQRMCSDASPEVGEQAMLRLVARVAPDQLGAFIASIDEAISCWIAETAAGLGRDTEAAIARVHALKSVTAALGSSVIANACDELSETLRMGAPMESIAPRCCAVAGAAQRLLRRHHVSLRLQGD